MKKDRLQLTSGSKLLLALLEAGYLFGRLQDLASIRKSVYSEYTAHKAEQNLRRLINRLEHKGWIQSEYREAKRILKLTQKGELEALFQKSRITKPIKWDGKWSIISFDIPEAARSTRKRLRILLKQYGFKILQASVYVSPHPVSDAALDYLKRTKLIEYIRIFRAQENKDTADLKSLFKHETL